MGIGFEWDEGEDLLNKKKHGVSFQEAVSVFYDERALLIHDPDHSLDEDRFLLLGMTLQRSLLVVSHCYRMNNSRIRIISARKATPRERAQYEGRWES